MVDIIDTSRIASVFPLRFWTDTELDPKTGEMKNFDRVEWQKKGNPNHCGSAKISVLKKHDPEVYSALERSYEAWKKGEGEEIEGTPLNNWPPVSQKIAEHLKAQGYRSVEDLAKATDADLLRIGMGGRSLVEKAKAFIQLKSGDGKAAAMIAERDSRIDNLEKQLKEAIDVINEMKPKRGRPKNDTTHDGG